MAKDFIPGSLDAFIKFLTTFVAAITADPTSFGLTAAEAGTAKTALSTLLATKQTATSAAAASILANAEQTKATGDAEQIARGLVKKINGHPSVDNAMRAKAGLPDHDETRSPIGAPTTRPLGRLELTSHFTLTLHFVDELTPLRLAKPEGVHGCQIWSFVGDTAPADPSGYTYLATDTRTPYVDTHPAADGGKTVHYMLRWMSTKGEPGPWSDVLTAKIPV